MKGSLVVVAFFCAGCMIGAVNNFQYDMHSVSMYVLYALMLQVGISIGSNKKLKELIKSLRLKMLLVPMATIAGTLLFLAAFTIKIDCYVYYYIYYVCWYRYRICIAQLAVFTENRKEYITHYLPAAVCFGNLYRLQQLNH